MTLEITKKVNAGALHIKQTGASAEYGNDARLVLDQATRDSKTGHGTAGEGVEFANATADTTKDTYDPMTDIIVSYIGNDNAGGTAATLNFKEYVAVPKNIDAYIDFKAASSYTQITDSTTLTNAGVDSPDLTKFNYYVSATVTGDDNADKSPVFTITADTFTYISTLKTEVLDGYTQVKAAYDADIAAGATAVKFTIIASYNA
jgi:hypothetical protein